MRLEHGAPFVAWTQKLSQSNLEVRGAQSGPNNSFWRRGMPVMSLANIGGSSSSQSAATKGAPLCAATKPAPLCAATKRAPLCAATKRAPICALPKRHPYRSIPVSRQVGATQRSTCPTGWHRARRSDKLVPPGDRGLSATANQLTGWSPSGLSATRNRPVSTHLAAIEGRCEQCDPVSSLPLAGSCL
eukprot:363239-Chlamydomonas_euryale.AAC.15